MWNEKYEPREVEIWIYCHLLDQDQTPRQVLLEQTQDHHLGAQGKVAAILQIDFKNYSRTRQVNLFHFHIPKTFVPSTPNCKPPNCPISEASEDNENMAANLEELMIFEAIRRSLQESSAEQVEASMGMMSLEESS